MKFDRDKILLSWDKLKESNPFIDWNELTNWHTINEIKQFIDKKTLQDVFHIKSLGTALGDEIFVVSITFTILRKELGGPYENPCKLSVSAALTGGNTIRLVPNKRSSGGFYWEAYGLC